MPTYFAFLRGMNVGGHRIKNDELCASFEAMGFTEVSAFLASGNVVFHAPEEEEAGIALRIENELEASLGYAVPTFLRTALELEAIAAHEPFSASQLDGSEGKPQVALLASAPSPAARRTALALSSEEDRLALHKRELYWLPKGGISDSDLDFKALGKAVGVMTVRTRRTLERMVAKYLGG